MKYQLEIVIILRHLRPTAHDPEVDAARVHGHRRRTHRPTRRTDAQNSEEELVSIYSAHKSPPTQRVP